MKRYYILVLLTAFSILTFTGKPIQSQAVPTKFKVIVNVTNDNESQKNLMLSYLKRELRSLHDVEIVSEKLENPIWDFMITAVMLEEKHADGRKTGIVAMAIVMLERIPSYRFNDVWKDHYKKYPAVSYPRTQVVTIGSKRLDEECKIIISGFDTDILEPIRELRSKKPK